MKPDDLQQLRTGLLVFLIICVIGFFSFAYIRIVNAAAPKIPVTTTQQVQSK